MKLRETLELYASSSKIDPSTLEKRARDAVARLVVQQLTVPNIFFDAAWPTRNRRPVDILAIDRAGSGDVHVFEIKAERAGVRLQSSATLVRSAANRLFAVPGHFRWLVLVRDGGVTIRIPAEQLYRPGEMGRIGVIEVKRDPAGDIMKARIAVPAERFKGSYYDQADRFAAAHQPDIRF